MRSRPVAVVLATIAAFILATSAAAASPGAAGDGQPVIVVFQDNVAHPATSAASLTVALGARPTFVYSHALKGFAAKLPASAIAALRANPTIRSVEPDGPAMLADTTQTPATWGLDRIDQRTLPLNNAYTYAATGSGVQVYIIDSGIKFDHVDFGGRATLGADYVGDGRNGVDCNGHGTHVAGTVGGQVYGVAKAVSLIAVRTHDCAGNSTWSQVIAGVDFVTGQKQASPNTPMVANMSIQGSPDAATNTAVANSIAAGVSYAVAAGNGVLFGGDACGSTPALVPAAMTVGATTSSDGRAFYSNYGSCVDWFAPGDSITSDGIASTTATAVKSGTSMAAPATAGVAALYLQNHPNATPQEVRDALFQATTKGVVTSSNSTNNNLLYSLFAAAPPVLTTITVAPSSASVPTGGTQRFSATGLDQYGQALSPQPSFAWSVSGGGTINSSGLFSAGSTAGGPFTVTAASGGLTGTASVSVTAAPPVLTTITVAPSSASVHDRRDAAVQCDRARPVRPGPQPAAVVRLVGQRRRHDQLVRPVQRRLDRRRAVHGDRRERRPDRHRQRLGDGRPAGPDHDHGRAVQRVGPDRRDAGVQCDRAATSTARPSARSRRSPGRSAAAARSARPACSAPARPPAGRSR